MRAQLLLCLTLVGACAAQARPTFSPGAIALPAVHAVQQWQDLRWIVIEPTTPPTDAVWTNRAPKSYAYFHTAPAGALDREHIYTLVGPTSACTVRSSTSVYLQTWRGANDTARAIDVPAATCPDEYVIAVAGEHTGARATAAPRPGGPSRDLTAWVERATGTRVVGESLDLHRPEDPGARAAYLVPLPGAGVDAIEAYFAVDPAPVPPGERLEHAHLRRLRARTAAAPELLLRRGDLLLARVGGARAVAALHWAGHAWAVLLGSARLAAIRLD